MFMQRVHKQIIELHANQRHANYNADMYVCVFRLKLAY